MEAEGEQDLHLKEIATDIACKCEDEMVERGRNPGYRGTGRIELLLLLLFLFVHRLTKLLMIS